MTSSLINIDQSIGSVYPSLNKRIVSRLVATSSAAFLLWNVAVPLAEGFKVGGRSAVVERLPTVGARVEDFVPEDRSKIAKPLIGAFLVGVVTTIGEKVGKVFVGGAWPVAQAWFDRTTHQTDQMIWRGPDAIVNGAPVGVDDTVTALKFEEKGNLALAYKLTHLFASVGLDIGKFNMSATAQRKDCNCSYRTYGDEIEVWTSGKIHQTWLSNKSQLMFFVVATMDHNGEVATGTVEGSFGGYYLRLRPMILGSSEDKLQDDARLGQ